MHEDHGSLSIPAPGSALPIPPRRTGWRWSAPHKAVVAGGVLAAVLSLGSVAGAATPQPASGSRGATGRGLVHPTAAGKITALSGNEITVQSRATATEMVVYSASTTFRTESGSASSASLEVGDFIAVEGRKTSSGEVSASRITIGTSGSGMRGGGPGGRSKGSPPTKAGRSAHG